MNADRPIAKPEDDTLERNGFASAVADVLSNPSSSDCIVVSIYGPWGSGKTSVLNLICHYLTHDHGEPAPLIVRFNPWYFTGQAHLTQSFFNALSSALNRADTSAELKKAGRYISIVSGLVKPAKYLPVVGPFAELAGDLLEGAGETARQLAETLEADLDRIKSQINGELSKQNRRIIVLIDDIDRLAADEIRQLFRLVRSLADFHNVTYLLAFDREATVRALDDLQPGKGSDFLEKIVQVAFNMPTPGEGVIESDVVRRIDDLIESSDSLWRDNSYYRDYEYYGLFRMYRTPRDVVRFMNVLEFNWNRLKGEVNPVDLVVLTMLQVFCNDLYSAIPLYKSLLVVDIFVYAEISMLDKDEKRKKAVIDRFETLVERAPRQYQEYVRHALKIMFPRFTANILKEHTPSVSDTDLLLHWRVADGDNFDRYFRFGLAQTEISQDDLTELYSSMKDGANLKGLLLATTSKRNTADAVNRLGTLVKEGEVTVSVLSCLEALFDLDNELEPHLPADDFNKPLERLLWAVLYRESNSNTRSDLLLSLIDRAKDRSILLSSVIHHAVLEHDDPNRQERVSDPIVPVERLAEIKKKMAARFETWYAGSQFVLDRYALRQFYAWRWCDPKVNLQEKFAPLIKQDADLQRLLEMWPLGGPPLRTIEDFISIATLRSRIQEMRQERPSEVLPGRPRDLLDLWASALNEEQA